MKAVVVFHSIYGNDYLLAKAFASELKNAHFLDGFGRPVRFLRGECVVQGKMFGPIRHGGQARDHARENLFGGAGVLE